MTSTLNSTPAISSPALDPDAIRHLAGYRGPCITMQIPDHHPGAQKGSHRTFLHDLIRDARERMAVSPFASWAVELLGPMEALARSPDMEGGGPGFVVFRSPDFIARYSVPSPNGELLVIGSHFHLAPFVAGAFAARALYVLGISKNRVRLFEYVHGDCRELPLPAGVPASLEIAEANDAPEHRAESRSTAGPSAGSMHAVQFGTLTDRETAGRHLTQFFRRIDAGLQPVLRGSPLLIMGVREEINAYRRAAAYPHILNRDVERNVEHLSLAEIAKHAASAARAQYYDLGERVLAEHAEMPDRARTLSDAGEILRAVGQGRVHQLCFRAVASALSEDPINAAVVETLRNGGEVFALPEDRMPAASPLAAILRY